MAKIIRPYPILTRVRRQKFVNEHSKLAVTPCYYTKRRYANWYVKSSKTTSNYLNETLSIHLVDDSKAFVSNPNWRTNIAKGVDAGAQYSRRIYTYKPTNYTCLSEDVNYKSEGYGSIFGGGLSPNNNFGDLEDRALGSFKRKLNGNIGNAQIMAPLAESREIHRIIRQINGLTMEALRQLLAVRKTGGKSAAKLFGDIWLGFGFGINPMLKDIEKAANSILDYTTREDRRVRIVGTATRSLRGGSRDASAQEPIAFGLGIGFHYDGTFTQGVKYIGAVDLNIKSAASYSVLDHLGLAVNEIPSTLWELVPLSWAVDYFTTVSPWLDDTFYAIPGNLVYFYRTKRSEISTRTTPIFFPSAGFSYRAFGNPSESRLVDFSREKFATLPSRALRIKSVDEIASNGISKVLNLASVLAGRRGPHFDRN